MNQDIPSATQLCPRNNYAPANYCRFTITFLVKTQQPLGNTKPLKNHVSDVKQRRLNATRYLVLSFNESCLPKQPSMAVYSTHSKVE